MSLYRLKTDTPHPGYRTDNALCRDRLSAFKPPAWAAQVIVEGDAASSAKATIALVTQRDSTGPVRAGYLVFARARTWQTVEEKTVKNVVQPLPRCHDQRTWSPGLSTWHKRKTSWVDPTRRCLRDMGDVIVVLSTKGRNVSPENIKCLVTTLLHGTARQVVGLDQNR